MNRVSLWLERRYRQHVHAVGTLYAYCAKRQQIVGKKRIRDLRFVTVILGDNIVLKCTILYYIADAASMANVVNSQFPMYQIRNFQCSKLANLNVADSEVADAA